MFFFVNYRKWHIKIQWVQVRPIRHKIRPFIAIMLCSVQCNAQSEVSMYKLAQICRSGRPNRRYYAQCGLVKVLEAHWLKRIYLIFVMSPSLLAIYLSIILLSIGVHPPFSSLFLAIVVVHFSPLIRMWNMNTNLRLGWYLMSPTELNGDGICILSPFNVLN